MKMKKLTPRLILLATVSLIAVSVNAQTTEQNVNVTIKPSQTVEQRVADEIKAKELKKAAEEKLAAAEDFLEWRKCSRPARETHAHQIRATCTDLQASLLTLDLYG